QLGRIRAREIPWQEPGVARGLLVARAHVGPRRQRLCMEPASLLEHGIARTSPVEGQMDWCSMAGRRSIAGRSWGARPRRAHDANRRSVVRTAVEETVHRG